MRSSSEAVDMAAAAARRSSDGSILGLASYRLTSCHSAIKGALRRGGLSSTTTTLDRLQVWRREAVAAAEVESVAGGERVEDDAADHQRLVVADVPGVGLGRRAVDDGDAAAADHLHHVIRADDAGGVFVDTETEQRRVLGDQ